MEYEIDGKGKIKLVDGVIKGIGENDKDKLTGILNENKDGKVEILGGKIICKGCNVYDYAYKASYGYGILNYYGLIDIKGGMIDVNSTMSATAISNRTGIINVNNCIVNAYSKGLGYKDSNGILNNGGEIFISNSIVNSRSSYCNYAISSSGGVVRITSGEINSSSNNGKSIGIYCTGGSTNIIGGTITSKVNGSQGNGYGVLCKKGATVVMGETGSEEQGPEITSIGDTNKVYGVVGEENIINYYGGTIQCNIEENVIKNAIITKEYEIIKEVVPEYQGKEYTGTIDENTNILYDSYIINDLKKIYLGDNYETDNIVENENTGIQ